MAPLRPTRRGFLAAPAGLLWSPQRALAAPFPVRLRKTSPWETLFQYIEPGTDEFPAEKQAAEITALWNRLPELRALPLAPGFRGRSPMPIRYREVAGGVYEAVFDSADRDFEGGLRKWLDSAQKIRRASFYVLPEGRVRYEIASSGAGGLEYRAGTWKAGWSGGRLAELRAARGNHHEIAPPTVPRCDRSLVRWRGVVRQADAARHPVLAGAARFGLRHRCLRQHGHRGRGHRWRWLGRNLCLPARRTSQSPLQAPQRQNGRHYRSCRGRDSGRHGVGAVRRFPEQRATGPGGPDGRRVRSCF